MWRAMAHFFVRPWGPRQGQKFRVLKILNKTLCIFSQVKDIKHISFSRLGHAPGVVGLGGTGVGVEGQKFNFYRALGRGQKVKYH